MRRGCLLSFPVHGVGLGAGSAGLVVMSRKVSGNGEARFLSTHLNPDSEQFNRARQIAWYPPYRAVWISSPHAPTNSKRGESGGPPVLRINVISVERWKR